MERELAEIHKSLSRVGFLLAVSLACRRVVSRSLLLDSADKLINEMERLKSLLSRGEGSNK